MNLRFDISLAEGYKSPSQIARILTEDWLARNMKTFQNFPENFPPHPQNFPKIAPKGNTFQKTLQNSTPIGFLFLSAFFCA